MKRSAEDDQHHQRDLAAGLAEPAGDQDLLVLGRQTRGDQGRHRHHRHRRPVPGELPRRIPSQVGLGGECCFGSSASSPACGGPPCARQDDWLKMWIEKPLGPDPAVCLPAPSASSRVAGLLAFLLSLAGESSSLPKRFSSGLRPSPRSLCGALEDLGIRVPGHFRGSPGRTMTTTLRYRGNWTGLPGLLCKLDPLEHQG